MNKTKDSNIAKQGREAGSLPPWPPPPQLHSIVSISLNFMIDTDTGKAYKWDGFKWIEIKLDRQGNKIFIESEMQKKGIDKISHIELKDKIDEIIHDEMPTNDNRPQVVEMILKEVTLALKQNGIYDDFEMAVGSLIYDTEKD